MDALLLGMASQIAEREDHVVVEDVRGEAKTVPAGCILLPLGGGSAGAPESGREGYPGLETCTISLLRELLT